MCLCEMSQGSECVSGGFIQVMEQPDETDGFIFEGSDCLSSFFGEIGDENLLPD